MFRDSRAEMAELVAAARAEQAANVRVANLSDTNARVLAAEMVSYARSYPDLDAGVAFELASNGVRASDPLAAEIASEDAGFQTEQFQLPSGAITHIGPLDADLRSRNAIEPYERLLEITNPGGAEQGAGNIPLEQAVEQISRLPRSYVNQILAAHEAGEFDNDGQVVLRIGDALQDEYGDDWRNVLVQMSAEEEMERRKLIAQEIVNNPNAQRELLSGAATEAQGSGFGIGSITRPLISGLSFGPQYITNRFRQAAGDFTEGIQTGASQAAFGGGGAGMSSPTLLNPTGLDTSAQGATRAATGVVNIGLDVASLVAPGGIAGRAGLAALPDVIEVAQSRDVTPGIRQAAAATDVGVQLDGFDSGDGLLLGEDIIAERQRRESALAPAMNSGELVTFGRAFAAGVERFDLDSRGYNTLSGAVDFWVALGGPGEAGAEGAVALARGGRTLPGVRTLPGIGKFDPLVEAGGLPSRRSGYVVRPTAEAWMDSWRGRRVAGALADMDSTDDVMRAFDGRISVHTARQIAETGDATGVSHILKNEMGISVKSTPTLGASSLPGFRATISGSTTVPARVRGRIASINRLTGELPTTDELDVFNLDDTYRWASNYLANASIARPEAKRILDGLAETTYSDRLPFILRNIAEPVFESTYQSLLRRRMDSVSGVVKRTAAELKGPDAAKRVEAEMMEAAEKRARELTRHFRERTEGLSLYFLDEAGSAGANPLRVVGDNVDSVAHSPHLITEVLHTKMPVPGITDLRELRRINKPLYDFMSRPLLREASALATGATSILEAATMIWKPAALLRAAYIMRVVGEEQLRIAAAGGDSIANNPAAWLGWVMARGKRGLDMNGQTMREAEEYLGVRLGSGRSINPREAFREAQEAQKVRSSVYLRVGRGEDGFTRSWAGEINQLAEDPIARFVAESGGVTDEVVEAALTQFRQSFEALARRSGGSDFEKAWQRSEEGAVRQYLNSIDQRIRIKTGENAELREAIANRKLGDTPLNSSTPSALEADGDFIRRLGEEFSDFAPEQVKGVRTLIDSNALQRQQAIFQTAMQVMAGAIIERPTSYFSRSPAFLQSYWEFAGQNAHLLRKADVPKLRKMLDAKSTNPSRLEKAADSLRSWGFDPDPGKIRGRIEDISSRADGELTLADFDLLAKGHAMDAVNDLLFNLTSKQQWQDSARVIAPFANAWQEVITRWGKLLAENPNIPRRVQQMSTALREDDLAETLDQWGATTIDGSGLMYTDDYGQEVVVVPWIRGNQPMSIPLSQLSVGASFLPGVGPAAALPLNWLLPDAWKRKEVPGGLGEIEELLFPFGTPTEDVFDIPAVASEFIPSWLRYASRAATGGDPGDFATQGDVDSYNGRVIATAQWLIANDKTGRYDLGNPDGWLEVIADAKAETAQIGLWQAFSAWAGPGPASPNFFVLDDDGNVQLNPGDPDTGTFMSTVTMANLYRLQRDLAIESGLDFDDADSVAFARVAELTNTPNLRPASIGRSRSLIPGSPPLTESAFRWLQDNPDVPDRADLTWGFFAPQDEGEFYYPMYLQEIDQGDRTRLTPEQWAASGQDVLADALYREAADAVEERFPEGVPDEARRILSDLRTELRGRFPGWQEGIVEARGSAQAAALELDRVTAEGGVFADHELAPAIRQVVETRTVLTNFLKDQGISTAEVPFASSQASAPYRQAYADELDRLAEANPEIAHIIDEVFRREIRAGLYQDLEREQSDG